MSSNKRRQTSAPCYVCSDIIQDNQDIVYCPVCGEQYHKKCWEKNGNKCKIYKCPGRVYIIWLKIESKLLSFSQINKSKLLQECPNCKNKISPLDRYCNVCGHDVNRPERQRTFKLYDLTIFVRKIHRVLYGLCLLLGIFVFYSGSLFIANTYKNINISILQNLTQNAPTITLTPRLSTPTKAPTKIPTKAPTKVPTKIPTKAPTKVPTKVPTKIRVRPTSTPVVNTPRPNPTRTLISINGTYAQISREIYFVSLRRSPGYSTKDNLVDVVFEVPSGETVMIIGGPEKADGLNWWHVKWNGYEGWIADRTASGKTILIFNP